MVVMSVTKYRGLQAIQNAAPHQVVLTPSFGVFRGMAVATKMRNRKWIVLLQGH